MKFLSLKISDTRIDHIEYISLFILEFIFDASSGYDKVQKKRCLYSAIFSKNFCENKNFL